MTHASYCSFNKKTGIWHATVPIISSGITRIPQESLGYYHEKSEAIASVKEFFATIDGEKWKTTKTLREKQLHQTTIALRICIRHHQKMEEKYTKANTMAIQNVQQSINFMEKEREKIEARLSLFAALQAADIEYHAALKLQKWWFKKMHVLGLRKETLGECIDRVLRAKGGIPAVATAVVLASTDRGIVRPLLHVVTAALLEQHRHYRSHPLSFRY